MFFSSRLPRKTGLSGKQLTELLLEGSFFGDPGGEYFGRDTCVRYFLAVPRQELRRSLSRMKQVLAGRR